MKLYYLLSYFFFFNDTATTEIYTYGHTLSLHDALPISIGMAEKLPARGSSGGAPGRGRGDRIVRGDGTTVDRRAFLWQRYRVESRRDRKSTRLNSSH